VTWVIRTEYATSVITAHDAFGNVIAARDAFGNVKDSSDLHGVQSKSAFDGFGRAYFSANSLGGASLVKYAWCSSGPHCPSGAVYLVDTSYAIGAGTARAPETWVYFDKLSREVLRVQQGFGAGQYIAVSKSYDALGRVINVSEPYFTNSPTATDSSIVGAAAAGSSIYGTTTEYDNLGRVVSVTPPNGMPTTTDYSGLVTTVTLPANASYQVESKIKTQNHLGQTIEIDDSIGSLINTYDASGNIRSVYRGGQDGKHATVTMDYDALGRKTNLNDPDLGVWTYTYNPVGEQLTQSSGTNGKTCVATQYDGQGRTLNKSDYVNTGGTCDGAPDVHATWTYDSWSNGNGLGALAQSTSTDNGIATTHTPSYDNSGRVTQVATTTSSSTYTANYVEGSTYDQYGRPFQSFFSSSLPSASFAETAELYQYNALGYAYQVRDAENGLVGQIYRQILTMDARGNVLTEVHGGNNALTTTRTYHPQMGWLTGISTPGIQNLTYHYDDLGNQLSRTDNSSGGAAINEQFDYDILQRLLKQTQIRTAAQGGNVVTNFGYDSLGNPSGATYGTKNATCTATGELNPGSAVALGPDAISSNTVNGVALQYCYDARGNQTRILSGGVAQQANSYTADDKLRQVQTVNGYISHASVFAYGPERQRVARIDYLNNAGSGTANTTHYIGGAEIIGPDTASPTLKRYLPGLILSISGGVTSYEYLFTDNLGSTHRITDQNGTLQTNGQQSFTAFGQRADIATGNTMDPNLAFNFADTLTHHGFTGQEQLDESGLVHMNGRIYSPGTMRFTSPDPFVQDPSDMQSYNRYSYVMNNPLTHTDPSGYWGHRQQGYLRTAAAIAITVVTSGAASEMVVAGETAEAAGLVVAGGAAAGYVQTGNLKGAVLGGIEAGLDFGIGQTLPFDGSNANPVGNVTAHAASGGVMSVLRGGKFGHGFVSAGLSAAIDPHLGML